MLYLWTSCVQFSILSVVWDIRNNLTILEARETRTKEAKMCSWFVTRSDLCLSHKSWLKLKIDMETDVLFGSVILGFYVCLIMLFYACFMFYMYCVKVFNTNKHLIGDKEFPEHSGISKKRECSSYLLFRHCCLNIKT